MASTAYWTEDDWVVEQQDEAEDLADMENMLTVDRHVREYIARQQAHERAEGSATARAGGVPAEGDAAGAASTAHVFVGVLVTVLVAGGLVVWLRRTRGRPAPPRVEMEF